MNCIEKRKTEQYGHLTIQITCCYSVSSVTTQVNTAQRAILKLENREKSAL